MTDHTIPDELQDLPDAGLEDIQTDQTTTRKHFAVDGSRFWVEVKQDLPGKTVNRIKTQNIDVTPEGESIDFEGLSQDMMEALISDTSFDAPIDTVLDIANSQTYAKIEGAVEEVSDGLEDLEGEKGKLDG
jgi:hypothetical protein